MFYHWISIAMTVAVVLTTGQLSQVVADTDNNCIQQLHTDFDKCKSSIDQLKYSSNNPSKPQLSLLYCCAAIQSKCGKLRRYLECNLTIDELNITKSEIKKGYEVCNNNGFLVSEDYCVKQDPKSHVNGSCHPFLVYCAEDLSFGESGGTDKSTLRTIGYGTDPTNSIHTDSNNRRSSSHQRYLSNTFHIIAAMMWSVVVLLTN